MEQDRVSQFKAEVSGLKIRTGSTRRDGIVQIVGVVLMVVGFVVDLLVYESSKNLNDPRDVQSAIILAIGFLALTGAGAAVFLYASLAKFLRFWLLRQILENRATLDQALATAQPAAPTTIGASIDPAANATVPATVS
jgi:peroxisomal membrane anchor protein 14 (PEX14)